ncbi:helix-turn-helix domain-containing protein [Pseudomonas sp. CES]|nr:helix-turn-helix domain-containing protein [Pseudomonas sp. CES]
MNSYTTPDQRWQAVESRETAATGHFVYAVRTTGIYCHPGCKSRLAK